MAAVPAGDAFEPLMTLYLTHNTTPEDIKAAAAGVCVRACAGARVRVWCARRVARVF
jgi:dihydroorotase